MKTRQVAALFIISLSIWIVGVGLLPLLPLYAQKLGADQASAGYYLAFCNLSLAIGATAAGWVSDRLQRRKLPIFVVGLAGALSCLGIGLARDMIALSLLTGTLWFCGGFIVAGVFILTGLFAPEKERGKYFGIIAISTGLGTMIGGFSAGYIVDQWGYSTLFLVLTGVLITQLLTLIFVEDKKTSAPQPGADRLRPVGLGKPFYFLFMASLLAAFSGYIGLLVRSLVMDDRGFSAGEISSTGAIGGLVTIPLPYLVGWLSDRLGRKAFMYSGYLVGAVSVAVLGVSTVLWHFWTYAILGSVSMALVSIASAFATDVLPPEALGKGLGLFNASGSIGGIFGLAFAGIAMEYLGGVTTIWIAISLGLLSALLIVPIRSRRSMERLASTIEPGD